jgi:L-alanine-DL-glutamate epimerase-like enolase superfamily enzyme
MSRNADAVPGRTERLIPLVRNAFGDAVDMHADANSSYDPPKAIEVGRMLEDVGAVYFEEPCPFGPGVGVRDLKGLVEDAEVVA